MEKIFCIGFNKTATTSLKEFMKLEGYSVADQIQFEQNFDAIRFGYSDLIIDIIKNDYKEYVFFQDVPFGLPNFYKKLYSEFPNAKYILTVRDNSDTWYQSLINYYHLIFSDYMSDFCRVPYIRPKWLCDLWSDGYGSPKQDPFNKESLTQIYEDHIKDVESFFMDKKNFIKINLNNSEDFYKYEKFLGKKFISTSFPHVNKSIL